MVQCYGWRKDQKMGKIRVKRTKDVSKNGAVGFRRFDPARLKLGSFKFPV